MKHHFLVGEFDSPSFHQKAEAYRCVCVYTVEEDERGEKVLCVSCNMCVCIEEIETEKVFVCKRVCV